MIERIQQAHALYCRLTGQRVSLRFVLLPGIRTSG